ncbi:MAG: rhomboid family intramembrane serine protease [Chloroflexi bacterium]|nr:rhomboid family intramembrane serine protease [Chloroflexota bacterium]
MIPLRDINPRRRFPLVTVGIILLNILVFLYEFMLPSERALNALVYTWGLVPYRLMQLDMAAILTVFTSMFMHSGFMHLLGNMLYLWIFGDNVESALGALRYMIFYLLCGVGAALGQVLVDPRSQIPMVGASGAISGILGAYLFLYPHAEVETLILFGYFARLVRLPALVVLGMWIVTQLLSGVLSLGMQVTGGVAWFAHIGGFFTGVVLVGLFRRKRWWE